MNTLNEIRFDDKDLFFNDNIVKTSILPQGTKDLKRNIKVQANSVFEGSVFGNNVEIEDGGVIFKGAVFANTELHVGTDISGTVKFNKAVAGAQSIAALVVKGRVLFCSDVNAPTVRLKNCYIGGSVFGNEVYLENCVVLGGVFATKSVNIINSVFGTFNAPCIEISGVNYMLYPAAFSIEPLAFLPQTELYNISMAHLGALYKGEPENENTGKIRMDIDDDHQRTVLLDNDDGSTTTVNSYSVSGRVLVADLIDFEKLENHFLIGAGALNSQILKAYSLTRADCEKKELTVENIADFFFKIISGAVQIQDISGEISFNDLKKAFE